MMRTDKVSGLCVVRRKPSQEAEERPVSVEGCEPQDRETGMEEDAICDKFLVPWRTESDDTFHDFN